jgi:PIN domain nuclease of toxin-antitoxin system
MQIFMWWDSAPRKLSPRVLALCHDHANTLIVSIASVWEMQIKVQTGKLNLDRPLSQLVEEQQFSNDIVLLPVQVDHVYALQHLPMHHKDPFDRLIIAQALRNGLAVVSVDSIFSRYPITVLD